MAEKPYRSSFRKGFQRTSTLIEKQIRRAGETRGFAVSRLLTHWAEIVGPDMAAVARPVNVSYARRSMGATLTVLTTGAQAPMLEMQKAKLRDRVNACYGYQAISDIRLTQTAPTGFAEGAAQFGHAPRPAARQPDPATLQAARQSAAPVSDPDLRAALERLGANVLGPPKHSQG
ncbi:DUF721 domain-containing protein [Maribius pontilimi]|uniref:DUF721 domain-containing protein n=1 Tax=Palleronia pontilimi TaxID=1964209 RepID=A0A934ME94_9RHOB|nr:DUF721 domain-containing protein [Palleronia pontilimi]MBJ3763216.1 DUF721 domain-containing protein [Palleronia pontilimi]